MARHNYIFNITECSWQYPGINSYNCPVQPKVGVILLKAWQCTIVDAIFGECHAPYMPNPSLQSSEKSMLIVASTKDQLFVPIVPPRILLVAVKTFSLSFLMSTLNLFILLVKRISPWIYMNVKQTTINLICTF